MEKIERAYNSSVLPEDEKTPKGKVIAYQIFNEAPCLRKASLHRKWMEKTPDRFAYRCLPLVIANQKGWVMINPSPFKATWNGRSGKDAIKIEWLTSKKHHLVSSHFGEGVLTFTGGWVFRTSPNWNMMVTGPLNNPKDGIAPLTGEVETDWTPTTFTMNWLFTRPGHPVLFEAGEPYCQIYPIPRYSTEALEPELRMIDENPQLKEEYAAWSAARTQFNKDLTNPDSEAAKRKWQRNYYLGKETAGSRYENHQTKLSHSEFKDLRPSEVKAKDLAPSIEGGIVIEVSRGAKPPVYFKLDQQGGTSD